MNQNSINNTAMEIKSDQLVSNDISSNLNLSARKPVQLDTSTNFFKRLGPNLRTFLGVFCEETAIASLLRKKCVVLLSVFLCSSLALEMKSITEFVSTLFFMGYACLGYQVIEDLVRYHYLKKTNSGFQKMECLFEMTDKGALMLFVGMLNLQYFGAIHEGFMLLSPLLFLLEAMFYWRYYTTSQSKNVITRIFYIFQSALIAAKMNNLVDLEWKTTLVFLWIYFGINAVYALLAGLLLTSVSMSSLLNFDRQYLLLLKNEIVGYIWHVSYNAFNVIGIVLLIGLFGDADDILKGALLFAKRLSIFLVVYTVLLFPLLKKQTLDLFQDLLTILQVQVTHDENLPTKHTLQKIQGQNKNEYFLKNSSTYFTLMKEGDAKKMNQNNKTPFDAVSLSLNIDENQLNISQERKDNMCYICESMMSDAILFECGHGGVCCDCAIKSVEQKNECMECRKPVKAIYKIESNLGNEEEKIIQASKLIQVI